MEIIRIPTGGADIDTRESVEIVESGIPWFVLWADTYRLKGSGVGDGEKRNRQQDFIPPGLKSGIFGCREENDRCVWK